MRPATSRPNPCFGTSLDGKRRAPARKLRLRALLLVALAAPGTGLAGQASAYSAMGAGDGKAIATLRANFAGEAPSDEARQIANWVTASGDNQGMPFMIVDKAEARTFLFSASGALLGGAPVLLGLGRGDVSPPDIGDRPLASIAPADRITPAGRFEATMGVNLAGEDILWVDYEAALSVHRATDPKHGLTANGRLARLASPTVSDNRISHGCVNVSIAFFEQVLRPAFADTSGIVYILPETRPLHDVFPVAA